MLASFFSTCSEYVLEVNRELINSFTFTTPHMYIQPTAALALLVCYHL